MLREALAAGPEPDSAMKSKVDRPMIKKRRVGITAVHRAKIKGVEPGKHQRDAGRHPITNSLKQQRIARKPKSKLVEAITCPRS